MRPNSLYARSTDPGLRSAPAICHARQVVGGAGFVVAGVLFALETQRHWWQPRPFNLGWNMGAWNTVGGIGFTLSGVFGFWERCCPGVQKWGTSFSTYWGSIAFLYARSGRLLVANACSSDGPFHPSLPHLAAATSSSSRPSTDVSPPQDRIRAAADRRDAHRCRSVDTVTWCACRRGPDFTMQAAGLLAVDDRVSSSLRSSGPSPGVTMVTHC